ncbi:PRC-barrel domain-containing protein [Caballeronia arationis]|jgi:hypothetical protein|uniref:PRC-barrel domain-containing protein n=1 Tax=Caballeronia arationis TaxID=1777142 RepID=A0A7Z7I965_9BURK|nr:hypothetical protein [Caballeronia arationis]SAK76331.1 PRC-barrel domain-containing protein [Caballeronia arationis]SOE81604.1 hypothetical protein SAMN05446927_4893 [Caballeronia arationis]
MTGGFSRRGFSARGLFISIFTALAALATATLLRALATRRCLAPLLALAVLPACSLLPQQTPVPIVEHSFQPPAPTEETAEAEEPSTVVAAEPASEPKTPRAAKPKRRVVKPKPAAPPAPPPVEEPEPPPPPQIISTRILQHDQLHGLLDSEVQRPDGKVIGRAVDMYVDSAAKPKVMMVNLAGFLGVGDRKVIFPWSAFRFAPAAKTPAITLGASAAPATGKAKADAPPKPQPVKDVPPNLMQLVDSTVLQKNGARMGRVVDVLIDSQAEPQAVVIDLSDSLSGDKRHVAASWGDLRVVSRNKTPQLQMDFTDAQLKASPTYGPEQPIKIVSPVVPAPASAPASAAAAASAASAPTSSGPVATGPVASGATASGARASR